MHKLLFERIAKAKESDLILDVWQHGETYELPAGIVAKFENIVFCKRSKKKFILTKHTDFKQINEMSRKLGLINDDIFKRVERIREKRNAVHLQGLSSGQQNWNVRTLNNVLSMFGILSDKVNK